MSNSALGIAHCLRIIPLPPAVSYPQAFEALNAGDYVRAGELLERAAEESDYANDIINHAYTLALYKAGNLSRLADVSYRVGNLLLPYDPASALDYFQRALNAGLNRERCRRIGEIHEEWFCPRPQLPDTSGAIRIAHIVDCWTSGRPVDRYVRLLAASLESRGVEPLIFTTEARSAWFYNPSNTPQSTEAGALVASPEGDFIERGERIAAAVRSAGVSVALYHTDLSDQIAAYVASRRPAPIQVNVNHEVEMDADLFDGFIHLTQSGLHLTRFPMHPAAWIPPSSDIESQLHLASFHTRQNLGIESAATVSATLAALPHGSLSFVKAVIELLKRFPHHFHLFAGGGDVRAIRGLIHSEGVLPRVRFLSPMTDATSLLGLIDVCLAPFPSAETTGVLDAMGAGKPIVVKQGEEAAELVGEKELSAESDAAYIRIADRLFRDVGFRLKLGDAVQSRFQREFRPERFAGRVLSFIGELAPSGSESPRTSPPSSQ